MPKDPESERLVTKVAEHWRELGFDNVEVDPIGESVLAQTGDYRLSFEVTPKVGRAELGASGPCAEPESASERDSSPEFRSLGGSDR